MTEETFFNSTALTSNRGDWRTPKDLFDNLNREFHFELDAAANDENHLCPMYFTQDISAFINDWSEPTVFCNPPYSRDIGQWIKRAWQQSRIHGNTIVLLIPSRTDTNWWHEFVMNYADEIRLIKGRLKFTHPNEPESQSSTFPSAIVVFRNSKEKSLFRRKDSVRIISVNQQGEVI